MAFACDMCGKGTIIGRQHKHHPGVAGGRWKRRAPKTVKVFKPNLHVAHILVDDMKKRVRLCTKCLRIAKDVMKAMQTKKITPAVTTVAPVIAA